MERHLAWVIALVVVLMLWIGLICCGAKAKKKRGSLPRESTELANGEVSHGPTDRATVTEERIGHDGRYVVEEEQMEQGCLSMAAVDMHTSTQAISMRASMQDFELCTQSQPKEGKCTSADGEENANGVRSRQHLHMEPARAHSEPARVDSEPARADSHADAQEDANGTSAVVINVGRS